jgi:hypothetical protein
MSLAIDHDTSDLLAIIGLCTAATPKRMRPLKYPEVSFPGPMPTQRRSAHSAERRQSFPCSTTLEFSDTQKC